MRKAPFLITAIIFSTLTGYGQSEPPDYKVTRNVVQLSAGFGGYFGAYNVNYERLLIQFEDNSLVGLWGKVGLGEYAVIYDLGGPYQHVSLGLLGGRKKSHFELNFGGARMYDKRGFEGYWKIQYPSTAPKKANYVQWNPVGSMGYRYQKPDGNFVFRTGLGYPEGVFIGLGVAF